MAEDQSPPSRDRVILDTMRAYLGNPPDDESLLMRVGYVMGALSKFNPHWEREAYWNVNGETNGEHDTHHD